MNIDSGLKNKLAILAIAAILAVGSCFAFSGCSSDDKKSDKASQSDASSDASDNGEIVADSSAQTAESKQAGSDAESQTAEVAPVVQQAGQTASEETKYGDAEVYVNESGNPAAKTDSGVEVEITGENLNKLIGELEDVKGTGSEGEKELLDQIQLLLEAGQNANQQ